MCVLERGRPILSFSYGFVDHDSSVYKIATHSYMNLKEG